MNELLRFGVEHAQRLVESWPEILGGFVAFWMHTIHHKLFHAIQRMPHLALGLVSRRAKGGRT